MGRSFKIKFSIGFIVAVALLLGLYFVYSNYVKEKEKNESFKFYNYYSLSNGNVSKADLVDDTYLINFLSLNNYSSFNENNLNELMLYYIKNITKNKSEDVKVLNDSSSKFSLSKKAFIKSMEELFGVDVTNIYNKFSTLDFIGSSENIVVFDDDTYSNEDESYLLGVKSITVDNDIITLNGYLYSFEVDSEDIEKDIKNSLVNSVNSGDFSGVNNIIENYYGYVEEKIVRFRELKDGDFFKYQLVSITTK